MIAEAYSNTNSYGSGSAKSTAYLKIDNSPSQLEKQYTVAEEIVSQLRILKDYAMTVSDKSYCRLAPVMREGVMPDSGKDMVRAQYPPLFEEMAGLIASVKYSLENIEEYIYRTEI